MNTVYLIDTHAHLDMAKDIDLVISNAKAAGINKIIIPSVEEKYFEKIKIMTELKNISNDTKINLVKNAQIFFRKSLDIITIFENGICLVSSRVINEVVKGMEEDRITIETVEENVIKITDSTSDFSLNCMDWEEYPQIELNAPGSTFKLETSVLSNIISETAKATKDTNDLIKNIQPRIPQRKETITESLYTLINGQLKNNSNIKMSYVSTMVSSMKNVLSKVADNVSLYAF